jgi:hypothetical protein
LAKKGAAAARIFTKWDRQGQKRKKKAGQRLIFVHFGIGHKKAPVETGAAYQN